MLDEHPFSVTRHSIIEIKKKKCLCKTANLKQKLLYLTLTLTDDFDLDTEENVSLQGIHKGNMRAKLGFIQKLWPVLKISCGQTYRVTDKKIGQKLLLCRRSIYSGAYNSSVPADCHKEPCVPYDDLQVHFNHKVSSHLVLRIKRNRYGRTTQKLYPSAFSYD